ncbi:uncharacterized protein PFL1_02358 [Pseudozyma flocculosa PF-1]|uniref:Uncharacterized protein n=1 Tax=Pseudozyma flocculosa TaxID=84751 RepID=A0A5C3F5P3_9BASI|nr:uncharacterized protein PFL1_02358 [Pseudozyma flocculosa PF-1]EPQ30242.1 hypothetical protein PFL1_02358 [Pseudozyma flocculosa PF-1]SPO39823.1 uncharacterized protein PSFLO_05304 [Pseudozyma flocculosa]
MPRCQSAASTTNPSSRSESGRSGASATISLSNGLLGWYTTDVEHLESLCRIRAAQRFERASAIRKRLHALTTPFWARCSTNVVTASSSSIDDAGPDEGHLPSSRVPKAAAQRLVEIPRHSACLLKRLELERSERILVDELESIEEEIEYERVYGPARILSGQLVCQADDVTANASSLASGYSRLTTSDGHQTAQKVQINSLGPSMHSKVLSVINPLEDDPASCVFSSQGSAYSAESSTKSWRRGRSLTSGEDAGSPPAGRWHEPDDCTRVKQQESSKAPTSLALPSLSPSIWRWVSQPRSRSVPASTMATSSSASSTSCNSAASSYDSHRSSSSSSSLTSQDSDSTYYSTRNSSDHGSPLRRGVHLPPSSMGGQRLQRSYQSARYT